MPDGAACGVSGMKVIGLHDVVKRVGQEKVTAVSRLSLEVCRGEIVSILGPSGCGKTTTLRLMAGLERPDSGRIVINGRVVASDGGFVPPERRNVGIVLQGFALFPSPHRPAKHPRKTRVSGIFKLKTKTGSISLGKKRHILNRLSGS